MRDLVPFAQFEKRKKHPWRTVTLLKVTLVHGSFSRFANCTNGIKSHKASQIQYLTHFSLCHISSPPENQKFPDVLRGYRNQELV